MECRPVGARRCFRGTKSTRNRCADLVYHFPIDAPMRVLFVNIYAAGAEFNFDGSKHYLIAACGMTSFAICEATSVPNSATFAAALMSIWQPGQCFASGCPQVEDQCVRQVCTEVHRR